MNPTITQEMKNDSFKFFSFKVLKASFINTNLKNVQNSTAGRKLILAIFFFRCKEVLEILPQTESKSQ